MKRQSAAKVKNNLSGKTFNNIKVLSYAYHKNSRKFYNVECLNCGKNSTMRSDRFKGKHKLSTCKYCRQKESANKSKARSNVNTFYNVYYKSYIKNAEDRNLKFEVSREEFLTLINQNCYYCNLSPSQGDLGKFISRNNYKVFYNGIDRKNNNKGYIKDNIVACCTTCNMMKKSLTEEEFLSKIQEIFLTRFND